MRALLRLRDINSQITVRDSTGAQTYPVRIAQSREGTILVVIRPHAADTITIRPRGQRTLIAESRRGVLAGQHVFTWLSPVALSRYEAELRATPAPRH